MKRQFESALRWLQVQAIRYDGRARVANVASRANSALHHGLRIAGLVAITAVGVFYFNPHLAEDLVALSPFSAEAQDSGANDFLAEAVSGSADSAFAAAAPVSNANLKEPAKLEQPAPALEARVAPVAPEQQRVSQWIAKRYRVASDAAGMLVGATYSTAREVQLDPLLILAVIAIESRFNPFAESPVGAKGLMQVMAHVHRDRFQPLGGVQAALNPVANIKVGASILRDYVRRAGSLEGGLKMYVGAAFHDTDSGYGAKVIAEYNRMKSVARPTPARPAASPQKVVTKSEPATREVSAKEARAEERPVSEPA